MKEIIINGDNFSNEEEFYKEMEWLLTGESGFKAGHNLDAFNDLLRGGFGFHDYGEKLKITWINAAKSREDLGYRETQRHWEKILSDCHPSNVSFVEDKIRDAKDHKGKTIFDSIVSIIEDDQDHECELEIIEGTVREDKMSGIERYEIHEEWAHSGIIRAGDFCFLGYCVGNIGGTIEEQINGAFDNMEDRLKMVGLTLENVVQMDCLFRDIWNIPVMEKVIKERFNGKYPVRKSIQTEFAHVGGENGLQFQVDAVAYCGK